MISVLGFKYTPHKINSEQTVYSFMDTPEIRKVISSRFSKNEFYISNTIYL